MRLPPMYPEAPVTRTVPIEGSGRVGRSAVYRVGDQLVQIMVWVPTKLSADDKKLLQKLSESQTFSPPKGDKSFFEKLRATLGV